LKKRINLKKHSNKLYSLAVEIFPICRSITGDGVRKTFTILKQFMPNLSVHEIPTDTQCFDWKIPEEWNVEEAYIETLQGHKVVDFKENNLHLVGYSVPVEKIISKEDLDVHLHSRSDLPDAIPYITSYYKKTWGFCMADNLRHLLKDNEYRVKIASTLKRGSLTYADLIIPGKSDQEILFSTYVCHPSMGNNEVSGIVVTTELAQYVSSLAQRRYTYRFVFVPETIGAIAYISQNLDRLKSKVIAGFVVTCVGDNRAYSLLNSKNGETLPDRVAQHVLKFILKVDYQEYSYLERGSDERQYSSPGVNLPVVSVMRSKYGTYREYHTSLDDLHLISSEGLNGGYAANRFCIEVLEENKIYKATKICEPFLSPRGLRPPLLDGTILEGWSKQLSDILAYADGELDLLEIANILGVSMIDLLPQVKLLLEHGLLTQIESD